MPKPRTLYLDTSIFGGYFDAEFSADTRALFEGIAKNGDLILISTLTIDELSNAPVFVREFCEQLQQKNVYLVEETLAAVELAEHYIEAKVVGRTSQADCLHIALATINRADLLVSWNFKHIVNINRILGYNHVNAKFGYPHLEIRSPKSLIDHEKGQNI